jgi:hypothetical protein
VRARDTDLPAKSRSRARSRRAFFVSAFVTFVLLLVGALYWRSSSERAVTREPTPPPAVSTPAPSVPAAVTSPPAAAVPVVPEPEPAPVDVAQGADKPHLPRPGKPKRDPKSGPQVPDVDIQLTR